MFEHWKDHFHPHEGNDHNPHAYRKAGAIALGLVVLSIVALTSLQSNYITHSDRFLSAVLPSVLVDLTNEDRSEEGLGELEPNETLKQAAQMKADHMAELGYFAHDAPDGTTPWAWFARAGYEYETAGENLAINFSDSKDVEEAWMDSQLHRENILEEDFTEIGIATAKGEYEGEETVFVVQMFGRPSAEELSQRGVDADSDDTAEVDDEQTEGQVEEDSTEDIVAQAPQEESSTDEAGADNEETQEGTAGDTDPIAQAPEPEPEPTPEPDNADTADDTETEEEPEDTDEVATTAPTFATPTPVAQVQGESGISLQPFSTNVERQASQMAHLLSQPEFVFRALMMTLFGLIALALLISVGVEAKRHHVTQAAKALGALVVLMIIFYFGITYLFADPDIANQSDSRLSAEISLVGSTPSS